MLTTARPIFVNVPASFADPVGLAEQQAPGVVSLIVVRYAADSGDAHGALGPCYDSYVAVSGQLLAVARTTADYRYPVTPSVGLTRFIEQREAGRPAFVSVYELTEDDCTRFLETVFFSECLKLHVDGADSAPLVAHQIARSGCGNGVLEVNDFSDPQAPRIRLVDLDELAGSIGTVPEGADPEIEAGTVDPGGLSSVLSGVLSGVSGRVLLYDRAKNMAAARDRAGRPFDLAAAIEEANRLATARRGTSPEAAARSATVAAAELRAQAPPDQVERVEGYLREHAARPQTVPHQHPTAQGLSALVAEMQGRGGVQRAPTAPHGGPASVSGAASVGGPVGAPVGGLAATLAEHAGDMAEPASEPTPEPTEPQPLSTPAVGAPAVGATAADTLPAGGDGQGVGAASGSEPAPFLVTPAPAAAPATASPPPQAAPTGLTPATAPALAAPSGSRHVLATELDVLRAEVFALFEAAVNRDRAIAHEEHVVAEHSIPVPVPSEMTMKYLRAILTDDPPKRWHFFKRSRGKVYEEVCAKLLAFHSANAHVDDPVIHEASRLWSRLCK